MKVYGLPNGQGLVRRNDMARVVGEGRIIPAVLPLARATGHKPSSCPMLRFLLLLVHLADAQHNK